MRAANSYTYTPFGQLYEGQWGETIANPWKFTGQWHDAEIDQYHLRARQYDPTMMRFTSRDPVRGFRENPLTLHKYLYCLNEPINKIDPSGKFFSGLWARTKNAVACAGAKKTVTESVIWSASVANGLTQGWINVLFGPSDISDKAAFWVGFAAGFGEMQIGLRTGSATLATTAASTFTAAANSALSKSSDFLTLRNAISIGISASVGGFGDWASDSAIDAVTLWAIGVDAALFSGLGQMGYDEVYGK